MKTGEIENKGGRKARSKNGERGQKMMSFRCDVENLDWLSQFENRGRYLNELIAADRERHLGISEFKELTKEGL